MRSDGRRALYLDASALVKLVIEERESDALREHIGSRDLVSSTLAITEVPRAAFRQAQGTRGTRNVIARLLGGMTLMPVTTALLANAGAYDEPFLRSLDAIHLATAQAAAHELDAFVGYDRRQLRAAAGAGLAVASPA